MMPEKFPHKRAVVGHTGPRPARWCQGSIVHPCRRCTRRHSRGHVDLSGGIVFGNDKQRKPSRACPPPLGSDPPADRPPCAGDEKVLDLVVGHVRELSARPKATA